MPKKAIVFLAEGFEEIEALATVDILRRCGVEVVLAGVGKQEIKSARNIIVKTDKILTEADTNYDACILHGGSPGASNLAQSPIVESILKTMVKEAKIIAAICAAPAIVLGAKGLLNGKKATCFPGCEKYFDTSTKFSLDPVVIDGNIITSRAAGTTPQFAFTIVEQLGLKEEAEKVRTAMLYK